MMMVMMIMTVALRARDTISSKMELCPAVEKGGSSVLAPSDDRGVTDWKLQQELRKKHNVGGIEKEKE